MSILVFPNSFLAGSGFIEVFKEAIDCYSATIYHSLTSEMNHIYLTQALEAYHGIKLHRMNNGIFVVKFRSLLRPTKII
jgi:hypothetical protein